MNGAMRIEIVFAGLAVAVIASSLPACGGGSSSGSTKAEYAYVANEYSDTLSQYAVGAGGALTPSSPATISTGQYPASVAVDPAGRYVYVANSSGTVSQYKIGTGGALTALSPAAVTAGNAAQFVVVAPSGKYVYVANSTDNTVYQYTIGSTGALTSMSPATVATGQYPIAIGLDPSGKYAYVANMDAKTVSQYTIGTSGALTSMGSAVSVPGSGPPNSIAVDPSGKYVYVAGGDLTPVGGVSLFSIGTMGELTSITGAAIAFNEYVTSITLDPLGKHAYVTTYGDVLTSSSGSVYQYTVGTDGALTPMSPATVTGGSRAMSIAVDSAGRYAYTANMSSGTGPGTVAQYTAAADGSLTAMLPATLAAGNAPRSIAIASVTSGSSTPGGGGGGGGGSSIVGTWSGSYNLTTDFSYFCDNIGQVTYSGPMTITITAVDILGMLTGTVSMTNMTVVSVEYSTRQCTAATLSPTDPIVEDGGLVVGNDVRVNTDLGPSFGSSYWGTNQLLFFVGTRNGSTISGTVTGMTDGGTSGTTGTFSVTKTG